MSTAGTIYDRDIKNGHGKLLSVATFSGQPSAVFTNAVLSTQFDNFVFLVNDIRSTAGYPLYLYASIDNAASWIPSSAYYGLYFNTAGNPTVAPSGQQAVGTILIAPAAGATNQKLGGEMTWVRRGTPAYKPFTYHFSCWQDGTNSTVNYIGGGGWLSSDVNAIAFSIGGGVITNGSIRCYGLRTGA